MRFPPRSKHKADDAPPGHQTLRQKAEFPPHFIRKEEPEDRALPGIKLREQAKCRLAAVCIRDPKQASRRISQLDCVLFYRHIRKLQKRRCFVLREHRLERLGRLF